MSEPQTRNSSATFQPRFTLSLVYLALLFVAYSLLLVSPELTAVEIPDDPAAQAEAQAALRERIRQVAGPRLPVALLLTLGTLALGIHQRWLPGLRPPTPRRSGTLP